MKLKMTLAAVALLLTFGSGVAHADSINFTLTNGSQHISGQNGGTLTFAATTDAPVGNGARIYLNSDSFNVDNPLSLDDTAFFVNFPFFLDATDSFTGDLFTLTIGPGTAAGVYHGTFSILGGVDGSAQDTLGTVNFSATVTPEPSSFILLGTGAAGVLAAIRRKRIS